LPEGWITPGGLDGEGADNDLLPIAELSGLLGGAGFERGQSSFGLFSALAGRFDLGSELISHGDPPIQCIVETAYSRSGKWGWLAGPRAFRL
jgi:hypothetical protein